MSNSKRYAFWQLTELECALDAQSLAGRQVKTASFRKQTYLDAPGVFWHRIGYCTAKFGTPLQRAWLLLQQAAGWEPVSSSGAYTVFRRPAADGDKPPLQEGSGAYCAHLSAVIRRLEAARNVCFIVTLLPLMVGYALSHNTVTRLAALPLVAALALTYAVKIIARGRDAAE